MSPVEHPARVVPVHLPGRLTASASLVLARGAAWDPPGREGAARTWALLLRRGGGHADPDAFETALEELGSSLTVQVTWQSVRLTLDSTPDRLADALALTTKTLRRLNPDKDSASALAARRRTALASLRRGSTGPSGPFPESALFPESRYGHGLDGDAESAARIDGAVLRAFHDAALSAPRTLVIAGDLGKTDVEHIVASVLLPDVPDGAPAAVLPGRDAALRHPPRPLTVVERPGRGSCTVTVGVRASAQGGVPLLLEAARRLLAANPSARLTRALRGPAAMTYALHSTTWHDERVCCLKLRFDVAARQAPAAVRTVLDELFDFADREPAESELREVLEACRHGAAASGDPAAVAATLPLPWTEESGPDGMAGLTPELFVRSVAQLAVPERTAVVVEGQLGDHAEELRLAAGRLSP